MPNIRPISDMRNYGKVLQEVAVGAPLYLTKNGRGRYVVVDMQEYEKMQATLQLLLELDRGRKSEKEKGWLSSDDIRARVDVFQDEEA